MLQLCHITEKVGEGYAASSKSTLIQNLRLKNFKSSDIMENGRGGALRFSPRIETNNKLAKKKKKPKPKQQNQLFVELWGFSQDT